MGRPSAWTERFACSLSSACLAAWLTLGATPAAHADASLEAPEHATELQPPRAASTAKKQMVAAANPLAAEAGLRILRDGGSAIDAAIAVQMVLTLVEPQSSGIGGGAFLLHWDGHRVQTYDGREAAPEAATEEMFIDRDGHALPFRDAASSGLAVGVPGVLRMLEQAHREHGRLKWAALFAPAIELAQNGFPVSARLHALLARDTELQNDPALRRYFFDEQGQPLQIGQQLKNPALAETLRALADGGADAFYGGAIAADIVRAVQTESHHPGLLAPADLTRYRSRERAPVCAPYLTWRVCGMGPPSSGGIAIAQVLGILSELRFDALPQPDLAAHEPTAQSIHLISEAERLAFADRDAYLADTDFVHVDAARLLDPNYLAQRARLIGARSIGTAAPGPADAAQIPFAPDRSPPRESTSHVSVVDQWGNAVAMTTSIETEFGSHILVRGFLLNNQLTDFSFQPRARDGGTGTWAPVANRVQPGKRPLSTMSPTLVFDQTSGELKLAAVLGSPGGTWIVSYVVKALVGMLNWQRDPQQAAALPNFGSRNGPTELEAGRFDAALVRALQERGHKIVERPMTSGLQIIGAAPADARAQNPPIRWIGGADPRREGVAIGD